MASTPDYLDFVLDQLSDFRTIEFRAHRMFGEYCIYANEKPICFVIDNQVIVKPLPAIEPIMVESGARTTTIFPAPKPWFILDVENHTLLRAVIPLLEKHGKVPQKRSRGRKKPSTTKL